MHLHVQGCRAYLLTARVLLDWHHDVTVVLRDVVFHYEERLIAVAGEVAFARNVHLPLPRAGICPIREGVVLVFCERDPVIGKGRLGIVRLTVVDTVLDGRNLHAIDRCRADGETRRAKRDLVVALEGVVIWTSAMH